MRKVRKWRTHKNPDSNPIPLAALAPAFLAALTGAGAAAGSVLASNFLSKKADPQIGVAQTQVSVNKNPSYYNPDKMNSRDWFLEDQDSFINAPLESRYHDKDAFDYGGYNIRTGYFDKKNKIRGEQDKLRNMMKWSDIEPDVYNNNPVSITSVISDGMLMEIDRRNRSWKTIYIGIVALMGGYIIGKVCGYKPKQHEEYLLITPVEESGQ